MKIQFFVLVLMFTCLSVLSINAQVGIGTTNPQNDLHVNGGVRIENLPEGTTNDAQLRLLATNSDGDIVQVEAKLPASINIPKLAFNAQFGSTISTNTAFFPACNSCPDNTLLRLNLNDENIRVSAHSVTLQDPNERVNSDEYFVINESGIFRFETNLITTISDNRRWLINLKLKIISSDGTETSDSIRAYAGKPDYSSSSSFGDFIGVPIYVTDTRSYNAGDKVVYYVEVVNSGTGGNAGDIKSSLVTNATYKGQITITQY